MADDKDKLPSRTSSLSLSGDESESNLELKSKEGLSTGEETGESSSKADDSESEPTKAKEQLLIDERQATATEEKETPKTIGYEESAAQNIASDKDIAQETTVDEEKTVQNSTTEQTVPAVAGPGTSTSRTQESKPCQKIIQRRNAIDEEPNPCQKITQRRKAIDEDTGPENIPSDEESE